MIPYGKQEINQDDINAVVRVLKSDYLTQGPTVPEFEEAVCHYVGSAHAIAVNSATSALHIANLALGVSEGDIVWTSPITFVASANCALYCGAKIDFVDIDSSTGNMCPKTLEHKLIQAKRKGILPKVIIPVHLAGHSCDMQAIGALAKKYNIKVIEDASHAIGASYQQEKVGACQYSDITVFSFHPVKIITTAEGGIATTNNTELATKMAAYRSHGITKDPLTMLRPKEGDWYYEQQCLGYNYRMTDIHAALGLSQIPRLNNFVLKRNQLAQKYTDLLCNTEVVCVTPLQNTLSSYHLKIILLPENIDRKVVFDAMREAGICVHVHYFPVHLQPYYLTLGFTKHDFPHAEQFYRHCLTLPLYPNLKEEQLVYITDPLKGLLK